MEDKSQFRRAELRVAGVVQGVGFRPAVYRAACSMGLPGTVKNCGDHVEIVLEGHAQKILDFRDQFHEILPSEAVIDAIEFRWQNPQNLDRFEIIESCSGKTKKLLIPADLKICQDCSAEIQDPLDRRYQYPFTTCTNCGPRFTVVEGVPYDRQLTTLAPFPLCELCKKEYLDPQNRRYHAETTACPECGPSLDFLTLCPGPAVRGKDPLSQAIASLKAGRILGVRGLGGFHLACDAGNRSTLSLLRQRKNRPHKPFAIMARNLDLIHTICHFSEQESKELQSPRAPILILNLKKSQPLPLDLLCPDCATLGLMLPTSALHQLLFESQGKINFDYLVMTSGNARGEPICKTNEEAKKRLPDIAHDLLVHDREIARVCDDSLAFKSIAGIQVLRRARGFVPAATKLNSPLNRSVLALGGDLKNTLCVAHKDQAILSQHVGDLSYVEAAKFHEQISRQFPKEVYINPESIAVDLHPGYHSNALGKKLSKELGLPILEIQHHHAHAVSCMSENGVDEALALVYDGTGLGSDGSLWGGELLYVQSEEFTRLGCFEPFALPGGDQSVIKPVRQAVARLLTLGEPKDSPLLQELMPESEEREILAQSLKNPALFAQTSSVGRLFDLAAVMSGLQSEPISYEGQAAIRLETAALSSPCTEDFSYPFKVEESENLSLVRTGNWILAMADERRGGETLALAWKFHLTLADASLELAEIGRQKTGVSTLALSGGVFQNRTLLELLVPRLEKSGFRVLMHKEIPANDGGISLGQAVIAGRKPKRRS